MRNKLLTILLSLSLLLNSAPAFAKEENIDDFISQQADMYNLSETFIKGVIMTESSFRPNAKNGKHLGLMQISENTADWIAEELEMTSYDLYNPYDNIKIGTFYLNYLRNRWINDGYDSEEDLFCLTLLSYNRGFSGAKKWIANNDDWTNDSYVKKVIVYKTEYETGVR